MDPIQPTPTTTMDSVQPTSLPTTTIIIPANTVSVVVKPHKMWQIPEMLELIGLCLPLFDRRFETGRHRFVDIWDPKPLLRVGLVNKRWHKIMRGILWKTYDFAIMGRKVPMDVLKKNIGLVRNLSLMDKAHKKNAALWDALKDHKHIDRLEVHEAVFPIKRLIGPKDHRLKHLKLSGTCTRMHPFLLGYVERFVHLEVLELTRFKFTPTDWHRIIANKTKLRKLVILQQCVFEGFDDNEDGETGKGKDSKASQDKGKGKSRAQDQSMAMEIDQAESGSQASSSTNNNNATSNNDNGAAGGTSNRTRKRRAEEMEEEMESALDIGELPIEHLVLADNRLLFPIQRRILEACPHLQQLEICYSQRADGEQVATQVRESCKEIRPLTLRSTCQPWTPPMIDGMPQSVNDLILHTGQLDLKMAAAIRDRKDALTRLVLDFGRGTKGKRRLACVRSILEENTELREFSYHNHAEDKVFKDIMFKRPWNLPNLPNLCKLHIHGASPRAKYGGLPQTSVPEDWRQEYGGRKAVCCSARSFEDVHKLGPQKKSPLFDVALLDHVQNLDSLSEVVVSEAIYRKRLRTA